MAMEEDQNGLTPQCDSPSIPLPDAGEENQAMETTTPKPTAGQYQRPDAEPATSDHHDTVFPRLLTPGNGPESSPAARQIIHRSDSMRRLVETGIRFARSNASVLITGESGTGKELFAKLIHSQSARCNEKFVQVNCAALSENLLESELFGHVKGAYTGADQPRVGRFEWANGGTLLLDEVTEIPIQLQAKLLRVLEENVFQRVGCNQDQQIDVRVIATTNRDLSLAVADSSFRNDLFHRLNVLQLGIPPLRKRMEDLPVLCQKFIEMFGHEASQTIEGVSEAARTLLLSQTWPGNVRQLRNAIHRACVLAQSNLLTPEDFQFTPEVHHQIPNWMLELTLSEVERHLILANFDRFEKNKTRTAKHLGVTARTLHTKINAYQEVKRAA